MTILSDTISDATSVGVPIGVIGLVSLLLKMLASDRTRGERIEKALRESFAAERVARELEYTNEKSAAKSDYDASISRHKDIYDREIAGFQGRIAGYLEELDYTKRRVATLESQVSSLDNEVAKLRKS